jgi:hypothetical protein
MKSNNVIFESEYPIESGIVLTAKITKSITTLEWCVNVGLDDSSSSVISMKGDGTSVDDCMTRMRNLLLGMKDAIEDTIVDVKTFAYDEFNDEDDNFFGGKNAKNN